MANALGELPKIAASFAKGELSYSKVRAMTRVATADNEDYLLMIARHGTAYHMETLVRKYRRAKKLQDLEEANKQHDERSLQVFYEHDGSITLQVRLPAEKGALVLKSIELAMEEEEKVEARLRARADDEEGIDPAMSGELEDEHIPFDHRRADALTNMAESYLANGPAASSSADRYQVVLHVSAETDNVCCRCESGEAQRSNLLTYLKSRRGCRVGLRPPRNDIGFYCLCERSEAI